MSVSRINLDVVSDDSRGGFGERCWNIKRRFVRWLCGCGHVGYVPYSKFPAVTFRISWSTCE